MGECLEIPCMWLPGEKKLNCNNHIFYIKSRHFARLLPHHPHKRSAVHEISTQSKESSVQNSRHHQSIPTLFPGIMICSSKLYQLQFAWIRNASSSQIAVHIWQCKEKKCATICSPYASTQTLFAVCQKPQRIAYFRADLNIIVNIFGLAGTVIYARRVFTLASQGK